MSVIMKAFRYPKRALRRLLLNIKADQKVNRLIDAFSDNDGKLIGSQVSLEECRELSEIRQHAMARTDISDHLVSLFAETISFQPRLIVELGVRDGQSTFVFERAANLCRAVLVSVDILPLEVSSSYPKWFFIQEDDITLARHFQDWCRQRSLPEQIDFLFIDTSHLYEHTRQEIAAWFPLLTARAKVIFHDTHLPLIFSRKDHSIGIAWDNRRGVIAAIEEYLGTSYEEKRVFTDLRQGWYIRHWPHSCGFTVLEKLGQVCVGTGVKQAKKEVSVL